MTHQIFAAFSAVVFAATALPSIADAQLSAKSSAPTSRIARAIELEEKALALHGAPSRASEAAWLHKQAASLRDPADPAGVQQLAVAAHLFNYANRPFDARRTMEEAAERALGMGDLVRAAQAYVEATFLAKAQNNRSEMNRLGRKALLLTHSPRLTPEERRLLTNRIGSDPVLAALLK